MLRRANGPTGWHQLWVQLGKLNDQDHLVRFHEDLCAIVETLACYDQLDGPALASVELLYRQIQICEDALKHKFGGHDASSAAATFDRHLMAGSSSRSQLCICPQLMEYVAAENAKITAVEKERRKAR